MTKETYKKYATNLEKVQAGEKAGIEKSKRRGFGETHSDTMNRPYKHKKEEKPKRKSSK